MHLGLLQRGNETQPSVVLILITSSEDEESGPILSQPHSSVQKDP